ncbi:aspartate carbamoyltransferase catalytic subunit [Mesobacterium pallidum]|uniref:aspartate carbamoyltransferase catalytic subunit n=1 Tax=Mesobacterium pallidum TaxID=2872037 RepID=UPI001EE2DB6C|nr:aspartate carbamoyltransferase catalytic subunit [Mesobacterium pallidum]
MSDKMHVPASETGTVRVFHVDLPPEAIERFVTQAGTGEWPLPYALGATVLKRDFVDVVAIKDLGEMGLSGYLEQAYDVTGADFKAMKPQLDALRGHVLVIPSQAFGGKAQELSIGKPLRWVGTFAETRAARPKGKLRSKSAKGVLAGGQPPVGGTRMGFAQIILIALAVLVLILVTIWAGA